MDLSELEGLQFSCLPGCGYCCTTSPGMRFEDEARIRANPAASPHVIKRPTGQLALALQTRRDGKPGAACACLGDDRNCGVYEDRPTNCRLFPFHVHLGRRVQVNVNLGCPGVWPDRRALVPAAPAAIAVRDMVSPMVDRVLATPDVVKEIEQAKTNYREFDRRMRELEWNVDQQGLARAFAPALPHFLDDEGLARVYSGITAGDLDPRGAAELPLSEPLAEASELLEELALEAFPAEGHTLPTLVDRDLGWLAYKAKDGEGIHRLSFRADGTARAERVVEYPADALLPWSTDARAEGAAYLALLTRRDHLWGAAATLTDQMEYGITFASAYARVLADVAGVMMLHGGLAALARGADEVGAEDARDAVGAADMQFLSLPTLGAVL